MEERLRRLFDYQKFERNEKLQEVIDGVKSRVKMVPLSDDDLDNVAAAGDIPVRYSDTFPNVI